MLSFNLCFIWNCWPQNLSWSSRQSPKGYQTQRSIQQPGFPSRYIIAVMAEVVAGRGGQVQDSCRNQAICQVKTNRSGREQTESQAAAARQWGHLAVHEEVRALPVALPAYFWSSCLDLRFIRKGKQEIKEYILLVGMDYFFNGMTRPADKQKPGGI